MEVEPTLHRLKGQAASHLLQHIPALAAACHLEAALSELAVDDLLRMLRAKGRVGVLARLKAAGITRLSERQMLVNLVSKLARTPAPPTPRNTVRAGDPHLILSAWNWALVEGVAVTASPGASAKLSWVGGAADEGTTVDIVVDVSESPACAYMTLGYTFDEGPMALVAMPISGTGRGQNEGDDRRRRVSLPPPGAVQHGPTHTLRLWIENSVQRLDRWGDAGADGRRARLPAASLRLVEIRLPPGAEARAPPLRGKRLLVFGDSLVEGVGVDYQRGMSGELKANSASSTFAAHLADRLGAEVSPVGYGRHGWTLSGNGNVPRFCDARHASVRGASSWDQVFAGVGRSFADVTPDYVVCMMGTNDGLIPKQAGSPSEVLDSVVSWLGQMRDATGPGTDIFLVVPFGGFGGESMPPHGVLPNAVRRHLEERGGADPRLHLVDLGPAAATNLTGFRFDASGTFLRSAESADGVHPSRTRHGVLGAMLFGAMESLLAHATYSPTSVPHTRWMAAGGASEAAQSPDLPSDSLALVAAPPAPPEGELAFEMPDEPMREPTYAASTHEPLHETVHATEPGVNDTHAERRDGADAETAPRDADAGTALHRAHANPRPEHGDLSMGDRDDMALDSVGPTTAVGPTAVVGSVPTSGAFDGASVRVPSQAAMATAASMVAPGSTSRRTCPRYDGEPLSIEDAHHGTAWMPRQDRSWHESLVDAAGEDGVWAAGVLSATAATDAAWAAAVYSEDFATEVVSAVAVSAEDVAASAVAASADVSREVLGVISSPFAHPWYYPLEMSSESSLF